MSTSLPRGPKFLEESRGMLDRRGRLPRSIRGLLSPFLVKGDKPDASKRRPLQEGARGGGSCQCSYAIRPENRSIKVG